MKSLRLVALLAAVAPSVVLGSAVPVTDGPVCCRPLTERRRAMKQNAGSFLAQRKLEPIELPADYICNFEKEDGFDYECNTMANHCAATAEFNEDYELFDYTICVETFGTESCPKDKCYKANGEPNYSCDHEFYEIFCHPPITCGSCGDPHFKTWAGKWYDYHGVCDLVLLHAPDFEQAMNIHIRTKDRYQYSYIESAALQIGEDILEVTSYGEYFYNGIQQPEFPLSMGDGKFPIQFKQVSDNRFSFRITIDKAKNEAIVLATFKDLVSVSVENGSPKNFATSVGLMGTFQGGDLVARDGTTILQDLNAFGQEWQVQQSEPMLFQVIREPQHPNQECILPDPAKQSRRLAESSVDRDAAELACAHYQEQDRRDMCIFDVMIMEDLEVAGSPGAF